MQHRDYLLRCSRYIELNPVRAEMVRQPRDYPWSSYTANGEGQTCALLLTPHDEYVALGRRRAAYRALFSADPEANELEEIRSAVNGGFALGAERFKAEVTAILGRRVEPGLSGRPNKTGRPATQARLVL